jgi:hypothetical protein
MQAQQTQRYLWWVTCVAVSFVFLLLYGRTAAPSVLSGDSAEFQLAAITLGVPHPTTYPLYVLLGKFSSLIIPFGDLAWRVTMLSGICAAFALGIFTRLAQQISHSLAAAVLAALALGCTPGLWNAATLAEVYALLALLMIALATLLYADYRCDQTEPSKYLYAASLVSGLGSIHHGLFVICALPLFIGYILGQSAFLRTRSLKQLLPQWPRSTWLKLIGYYLLGLLPWLYPIIQFARLGPFNGWDYGLPTHYFWGAPQTWGDLFDLLGGGVVRRGIFRIPSPSDAWATLLMLSQRMWFEFGPLGLVLGIAGIIKQARRKPWVLLACGWVFGITALYLFLLGPAVADAPVFTLPMMLAWAVWIASGIASIIEWLRRKYPDTGLSDILQSRAFGTWHKLGTPRYALIAVLLVCTLAWCQSRYPYSNKRWLWLYREFGTATLSQMPPNAVILTHWEQGMALQYLRIVEQLRPDVWVDVVEPGDEAWVSRAQRRYADRPVYFVGRPSTIATEGHQPIMVQAGEYADLFTLAR